MSQQNIFDEKVNIKEKVEIDIRKPNKYNVIIHNDDYTSMEFVVQVLVGVFKKQVVEATKIMFDVHKKGRGIAGIYSYDVGVTKIIQAMEMCEESGFPLKLTLEEE
ncbi:ATP-dependent Clp protease adaptor ClpS [Clostridium tagluense]|uniref:ATP-dependent Clp protease adapter protein ClpS n=1 Tax=Clostridium tagluense TaxID=360422 RepID=A0A401UMM3_9CLOT|nr:MULTISPECIES: ATP-dependent Clp protease adaptor ClpS [Clostridium]MBU3127762.1 ATP-dependent Clp protease adaptor ClpS [Clostridium tagluense]MBW9157461.1 ATP-dependent Clp protease adaptor ClpS [Clostridium tagluense]MBZ9622365.1 ATP-dependent Clp protease adaptor ClpS [Clostridium sp. FP2]MBZ9633924.1 ATP-dependent Clp protease adaptor ClpS [Clostridium sp. FP1]MCB2299152.1 ATP-dependent Clp protease adaptor ClpS [Clostridium tagluense]